MAVPQPTGSKRGYNEEFQILHTIFDRERDSQGPISLKIRLVALYNESVLILFQNASIISNRFKTNQLLIQIDSISPNIDSIISK